MQGPVGAAAAGRAAAHDLLGGDAVAGGSGDCEDVKAILARAESRPKRDMKRREILDPSHVSKGRKVQQE